jgi:hypothetical protein
MKLQNRNFPAILAVLALLVMASVACSFSGNTFKSGNAQINLSLKEGEINTLLENSTNHIEDEDVLLKKITQIEMHDGFLRVFGLYDQANGVEANGSYDVTFKAEDGALKAEIIGVEMETADGSALSLSDKRIQHLNDELAEALAHSARESQGEVEFESVSITEDVLNMQVKVYWKTGK